MGPAILVIFRTGLLRRATDEQNMLGIEKRLNAILLALEGLPKGAIVFISFMLVLLLGGLDYLSGLKFSFSLFYLFPVSLAAWFLSRNLAFFVSFLSALTWFLSSWLGSDPAVRPPLEYWNAAIRLGFFMIVSLLLMSLRSSVKHEKELSRTDFLTGIMNARAFHEVGFKELLRANRYGHPFTVAYLDIDDFKQINDRFGHKSGDELLRVVARTLMAHLRRTDIIARVGGDEFILLLPESDEKSGAEAVSRLRIILLEVMTVHQWPATFSFGRMTFRDGTIDLDVVIRKVDELMYRAKADGKNVIRSAREG
jgi:diguanylate cyclase (GGDEF)-like protein